MGNYLTRYNRTIVLLNRVINHDDRSVDLEILLGEAKALLPLLEDEPEKYRALAKRVIALEPIIKRRAEEEKKKKAQPEAVA